MRILIVEDERKTGDYLRQGLSEAGFVTDLARDGIDGAHLAQQNDYDLVVLDVMLPGIDGWEVLRRIRAAGRTMPVLFLTARDHVDENYDWWDRAALLQVVPGEGPLFTGVAALPVEAAVRRA